MFKKFLLLTDEQIKDIFDNCRNIGICGAVYVAADWQLTQIKTIHSSIDWFGAFIFALLMVLGAWLFIIAQLQAYRKLKEFGVQGTFLVGSIFLYCLLTTTLIASIFIH